MRGSGRHLPARAFLAAALVAGVVHAQDPGPWDRLEGRVIREVRIVVVDVFDRDAPGEDTFLARLADGLHVGTRPSVVRGYLLFREGDALQPRLVRETERTLRGLTCFRDAAILPEELPGGGLRLVVRVKDAWTLLASLNFSHVGGQSKVGATLVERNVLGLNKALSFNISKDPERTSRILQWYDPMLLGSRWELYGGYSSKSDGTTRSFAFDRPFYALDAPWSAGVQATDDERNNDVYDRTDTLGTTHARTRTVNAWAEASLGREGDVVQRLGLWGRYYQQAIGQVQGDPTLGGALDPARDRRVQGLLARWSLVQDRFVERRDFAAMDRTEDLAAGWNAYGALGFMQVLADGSRTVPAVDLQATRGWDFGPDGYLSWGAGFQGRHEAEGWRQAQGWSSLVGYRRLQERQCLAGMVAWNLLRDPDLPSALYLGGLDGSRGYPNELLAGDQRLLAVLEDRFTTRITILEAVRLGFVVRADAAMVHRPLDGRWTPLYPSVGAGVRVGDLRSAFGRVYTFALAYPLRKDSRADPYQLTITAGAGF